jgi:hypothetical protein
MHYGLALFHPNLLNNMRRTVACLQKIHRTWPSLGQSVARFVSMNNQPVGWGEWELRYD